MSNYTIIQETTLELRRRIHTALDSAPDADLGLSTPEADITLSLPNDDLPGSPRLSLYLYQIEPDGHLRNQPYLATGQTGLRFPPMAVQLHYLITPLDEAEDQNHLMLGRILQYFHDHPFLESLNNVPLDNSHGGGSPRLHVTFASLTLEQLAQIWSGALDAGYQLAVAYTVRAVVINSDQGVTDAKRVMEVDTVVGFKE